MKISGIYKIQSIIKPERCYIGSSVKIGYRWNSHLHDLRKNKHSSGKLQNHYNKYGEADLQFSIILQCDKQDLIKNEQYFLDTYKPWFNICVVCTSCYGLKRSKEFCEKNRKRMLGNKINLGRTTSEETKEKLSKIGLGRKYTEERKQQCRETWIIRKLKNI